MNEKENKIDKSEIEKIGRENVLFDSTEPEGESVEGYDFSNDLIKGKVDYSKVLDSFYCTGFQGTHFGKAIEIIEKMRKENVTMYLGYSSNLVSSGLRDIFTFLAKEKMVDVIVTTAGGIEEDFVKCFGDFKLGKFSLSGELLASEGVNRTGNLFVPNSRYCDFEDFIVPILEEVYLEQKKSGNVIVNLLYGCLKQRQFS